MERFVAFDVETPNSHNDRMSAVGITVVENGRASDAFYSLVDPETHFDAFNIGLTGITPEAVKGAPTFGALWKDIAPLLKSGVLLAHNAPFDMRVLSRCLMAYGIDAERYMRCACTVRMARRALPDIINHRLNTLCDYYGIHLDHHVASSDSLACAELFLRFTESGLDAGDFIRVYDLKEARTLSKRETKKLV